jgi:hypothetical protein
MRFKEVLGLDKFWSQYSGSSSQTLPDGETEKTETLAWDPDELLTVVDADFDWKSPGSFAGDTEKMLGLYFYLILQHTEIPEFVWGNAIASSKASAEAQMPDFLALITMKQGEAEGWLLELAALALGLLALLEPGVGSDETPLVAWEDLTTQDGALTLSTVQWAYSEGLLDEATALMLAPLDVDDIESVLAKAKQEQAARHDEDDSGLNDDLKEEEIKALFQPAETGGD